MATYSSEEQELIGIFFKHNPMPSLFFPQKWQYSTPLLSRKTALYHLKLIQFTICNRNKYYQKLTRMANGLPYSDFSRDRLIQDKEAEEFNKY